MLTSIGTLLLHEALPEDLRKESYRLDKKGTHDLLREVAEKHPDRYKEVLQKLNDIGRNTLYNEGTSVSLSALRKSPAKEKLLGPARQKLQQIIDDDSITDEAREKQIIDTLMPLGPKLQDAIMDEAKQEGSPYHLQVISGSRGKKSDLNSLRGAELLTSDHNNKLVPIPMLNSYADGLDPVEYYAGMYGQRRGMVAVKFATGDAGFLNKQLVNAAHRLVVDKEQPAPTRLPVGLPVDPKDQDNVGAVLAAPAGEYPAGTVLTPSILHSLHDKHEEIIIHSPMTEQTSDGGISRFAAGRRDRFGLSKIGDNIGIPSAQAIGEKLSQGMLSCLVKGTMVRMADFSVKPIEKIECGDWVLGADTSGRTFPVKVNHFFDNGEQPCVETTFRVGQRRTRLLRSTTSHKVLAATYFTNHSEEFLNGTPRVVPVGKKNRDFRCLAPTGFDPAGPMKHEPAAYMIGMLLGDGCYTEAVHGVFLSCADAIMIAAVQEYLRPLNLRLCHLHQYNYRLSAVSAVYTQAAAADSDGWQRTRNVNPARIIMDGYTLAGKYAHEKKLPACVHSWDNASIADLIAGLIDTDGTVLRRKVGKHQTAQVGYCSTSLEMLESVRTLLEWRFGVYGTATFELLPGARSSRHAKHTLYSFTISDRDSLTRFSAAIKLKGVKADRLQRYLSPSAPKKRTHGGSCRRTTQTPIGVQHVFDIEVDHPDHLFVLANGLIVSNSKHAAGMAKQKQSREGFDYLNRLIQAPENFPEAGPLASRDGVVSAIEDAPQGGRYIHIGDEKHYSHQDLNPVVKVGDNVEAGDDLTDGVPHPADLVQHRGIGEARRVYTHLLREALENSGVGVHRRNLESVVAGLMNWAKVTNPDGIGEHVVDDVVNYNNLAHNYQPRPDATLTPPTHAVGRYLEEPALHYSVGTRVTKRVSNHLKQHGIKDIHTHEEPPGFHPHMQRGLLGVHQDQDFQTQLSGFYTSSAFQHSVNRGAESDPNGTSFIPGLVRGTDFGKNLKTTGHYG